MMIAFVVKNLWDYDKINPVPDNLPDNLPDMDTFYITDTEENRAEALCQGWDHAVCFDQYREVTSKILRRSIIGDINCFPEKFCSRLQIYDKIFVCDSNILTLPSNYSDFVNGAGDEAVYLTSGYYSGEDDTIEQELIRSIHSRWNYNAQGMIEATHRYMEGMNEAGIDPLSVSVSSAKYLGWNVRHPDRWHIASFVADEYMKHLQGNIIFTYISAIYKNEVFNFRGLKNDISFSPHNYEA
jgi:hypothetical protein